MAGLGMKIDDIARLKGMCDDTLRKYAGAQLGRGKAKAKATVMQTAYKMATSGKYAAMTIFWLKTQAAWRENMPEENPSQDELVGGLDTFLQKTLEQVKNGQLDPKVASVIGSLSSVLLKATEQAEFEQRLASLESVLTTKPPQSASLMEIPLDTEGAAIEFVGKDEP